jgi:hypothetical protein
MKNTLITLLFLFNQCTDKYYLDEKYADSYNLYGENVMNAMREYYVSTFKYPKTIDNVIKFIYDLSMSDADSYNDNYGFHIKMLTNLAKNNKFTQEKREKFFFSFAAFNFICMYKDYISINIDNESIAVSCDIDGRNIFNFKTVMLNKCSGRYDDLHLFQLDNFCFFDSTDYPIGKSYEFRLDIFNKIYNDIARRYKKTKYAYVNDTKFRQIAILSYKKFDGLSSLCPDEDIDLINDPFINDVKSFLSDLLDKNPDVYEVILPLSCYIDKIN